jgi:hypothetical protein
MLVVEVSDVFSQVFVMEKNSMRFSKSGGWGQNEGLHLPPVSAAVSRIRLCRGRLKSVGVG